MHLINKGPLTIYKVLSMLAMLSFCACASVPMASSGEDSEAKKFEVPDGKGRIYLYRNETYQSGTKVPITLDGEIVAETARNVYFYWDVRPGRHVLTCLAESNSTANVEVADGEAAYIWQEMNMGLARPGCTLRLVEDQVGRMSVSDCSLGKSKIPSKR